MKLNNSTVEYVYEYKWCGRAPQPFHDKLRISIFLIPPVVQYLWRSTVSVQYS
jgi:hypothetical protein